MCDAAAVRLHRTVLADLECAACRAPYGADVQFETGRDAESPVHAEGDEAIDLPPSTRFEGRTDRYCIRCVERWSEDEASARFEQLADDVRSGAARVLRLTWPDDDHSARDRGVPDETRPLAADEVRELGRGRRNLARGLGHVVTQLIRGELALVLPDGTIVHPRPKDAPRIHDDPTIAAWVVAHDDAVRARLDTRGWAAPSDDATCAVVVSTDADRCVRVER